MKVSTMILLGLFSISSCVDNDVPTYEFTVVVESKGDLACGLPVVRFLDKGSEVRTRTKLETLTYNAYHLDNSLNTPGERLTIEFEDVKEEDLRVCNTLGIGIPGIAIVHARLTN